MRLKEWLKSIPIVKKTFYKMLDLNPHRILFKMNLKEVSAFDKKNGTDFGGRLYWDEVGTRRDIANDYSPSPKALKDTLKLHKTVMGDKICDLGCGKGYAMFVMSQYNFEKVGGVELSPFLCEIARLNLKKIMPKDVTWEIVESDAGNWGGYDEYNVFYIYNSFPKKVMLDVRDKIIESVLNNNRQVYIWYLNPEYPEVFLNDNRFKLIKRQSIFRLRRGMWIFEVV